MSENRKPLIKPTVDATEVRKGVGEIKDAFKELGASAEDAGKKAGQGMDFIGPPTREAVKKVEQTTKSIISSIERTTAALKAGERGTASYYAEIANQRGAQADVLKPYLDSLRQAEAAQKVASGSLDRMGLSAKQTAAALRGVPAQFTDIATSIASGQAPLTVLLQQGGQLKDMFGGAGAAARALGGYVVGLINPFTLAAAAVAGLGYAYAKGSAEAQEFNKTLILSGNQAGVTANQLMDMAAAVRASGAGTQGRAAEIINLMASDSKIGAENIQRFTAAILQMERAGGPAAEELAKQFASLAKSPLESALKLNETTGFLTASVYEQIRALEQAGKTTDAAKVAQEAYAKAIEERSPELVKNLGSIERAWLLVKDAVKATGDAMLDVGRGETIDSLAQQIETLEKRRSVLAGGNADQKTRALLIEAELEPLRARLVILRDSDRWAKAAAASEAQLNAQVRARGEFDKEGLQLLSKREQMEREIAKARELGLAAGLKEEQIQTRIAAIQDKFKDKSSITEANRELEGQKKLFTELAGLSGDFEKEWGLLNKAYKEGRISLENLEKAQKQLLDKQPFMVAITKEQTDAAKAQAKARDELTKAYEREVEAAQKSADSARDQVQRLQDEEKAAAIAATGRLSLAQAIHEVVIARLAEQQATALKAGDQEKADAIKAEIAARRELIGLIGSKDAREAAAKSAKDAENEWKRATQQIEQSITDSLMRGFESGKGFAENLRDTVENMFKTMVLRPIVSAVVQPLAGSIAGFVTGNSAAAGFVNGASTAVNAYNGISRLGAGYFGMGAGGLWGSSAAYGGVLGTTSIGAGSQAAMLAAQTGEFGLAGLSATSASAGSATGSAGVLSSASSAIPIIGAIIAGMFQANTAYKQGYSDENLNYLGLGSQQKVLTKLLTSLGMGSQFANILTGASLTDKLIHWGAGTEHTGASSAFSQAAGLSNGAGVYGVGSNAGAYSKALEEGFTAKLVQSVVGILDSTATTFGKTAGFAAAAGFADDTSKDGAWGALAIKLGDQLIGGFGVEGNGKWPGKGFADGQAGLEEYLAAVVGSTRQALDSIGLPSWAKEQITALNDSLTKDGKSLGFEDLSGVLAQIQATQTALVGLGKVMPQLSGLTGDAATALMKAFGGIEQLSQAAIGYYENFYSQEERNAKSMAQLTASFGELGLSVPATRENFRALVEAQDLTTEAGQKAYAALLKLSPTFAALVPVTQEVGQAVDDTAAAMQRAAEAMAEAGRRSLEGLADDKGGLMVDLLKAQGSDAAALELARTQALAKLTAGVSDVDKAAITAAYDYNQAIRDQIAALQAASTAAEQAAATQRQAEADAKAKAEAIASQAYGLTTQILQLEGNTAELRRRELEQLDPVNRALQERIYALQDQKAAESAAAQAADAIARAQASAASDAQRAAEEQARAAEQIRSAWQSVTDSIFDEVKRIRGLINGGSSLSFANAQAQFAITSAQARAGDQEAAKLLPGLSQTLLTLAEAQATSLFELQRIRAQTAANLEGTAGALSGLFGLSIPRLATGTNEVPADMLAILHKGEAVVPAAYNPATGGDSNAAVVAELRGLREETKAQALRIVQLTNEMNKRFKDWDANGLPQERIEA